MKIVMPDGPVPPIQPATPEEVAEAKRIAAESAAKNTAGMSKRRLRRLQRVTAPPRRTWNITDEVIDPPWN